MTEEYTEVQTTEICCDERVIPSKYGFGVRHVQALVIFTTHTLAFLARGHLGATIVSMTNKIETVGSDTNEGNTTLDHIMIKSEESIYRTYQWPKSTQEVVLSSFFLGYSIMTYVSGIICQKWGGKIPIQISMFVNGIVSLLSPWVVAWGGWKALSICRILQGFSQGGMMPGIHTLLANWVPLNERARLSSYSYMGSGLGTVMGFQFSGLLAYSSYGWPSTFWTIGVLCLLGFTLITLFGAATPLQHKSISEEERNYIIGGSGYGTHTQPKVPWKAILTSTPVLAAILSHICNILCYTFLYMQMPTYMYAILKVNIKNSGILSSLPFLGVIIMCIVSGNLSDLLINKKVITVKNARRLANSVASIVPAIALCFVSYTKSVTVAVLLFVIAIGVQATMHSGWLVNYIDLSPNYSGILMAIGNGSANLMCVLILPVMVTNIVKDVTNQIQWRIMMYLMAAINLFGNIIFVILISTEVQPWNEEKCKDDPRTEDETIALKS
ncbi:putative inorganic phosphate cotransporter [Pieris brassicae]|uniref:Major facilitator superfamily (MFS) profile domain-containing protein n=1 Tax=Pieris brassicae TaxID=7116 RepID=A0A9P0XA61_PIEBR|nr:putative inorganic phosphate cotransporter [Pieris brassicae]CAH4028613.1 unnamed protein product [Pieris brassicae]